MNLIKQLIKFSLVGGTAFLIDFSVYLLLTRSFLFWKEHFLWANFIAFSLSLICNFALNKSWTFKDKRKKIPFQFFKFLLIYLIGLSLNQITLYSFVRHFKIYDLIAKILATLISGLWNFSGNKFFVFIKSTNE